MILVDTSVWVDHFRKEENLLVYLLDNAQVITHPFVVGEIALGTPKNRRHVLESLADLPVVMIATDVEVLRFIETETLARTGIGYVDAHLLASAKLTDVKIWTHDKKLGAVASSRKLVMPVH